jgi:hypothetical protein
MTPSPPEPDPAAEPQPSPEPTTPAGRDAARSGESQAEISTATLLDQLAEDRLWLLQQIDGGRWPELRLDLAALEREIGQLLDQARQHLEAG